MRGQLYRAGSLLIIAFAAVSCGLEPENGELPVRPEQPEPIRRVSDEQVTWYVRPDGGSAKQCSGLVDSAYSGSGSGHDCAWNHPFHALPPEAEPRIRGGDTLIIDLGSYMMGYGAPGSDICESDYPWDCHTSPIPSGPDSATPTRIVGSRWENGCDRKPELWGTERAARLFDLTGSSNVEIACLDLTDHSACVEDHSGDIACRMDHFPFGEWAAVGIYAQDSAEVYLTDLDIHGLAYGGIHAGRLTDWTIENVRIAANGWVGWDGDIDGDDGNNGTMQFRNWLVEWNGCGETYPDGEPVGCWGQSAGGYGDGIGTGETGGRWVIEDSAFLHNTSDGMDLLYTRRDGSEIVVRRTKAEGNAGDQFKSSGPVLFENVVAVSNCGFFTDRPFTHHVDECRAGGSAIAITLRPDNESTIQYATIAGQGDCLVIVECQEDENCRGSETVIIQSSIMLGHPEFGAEGDITCLVWHDMGHNPLQFSETISFGIKDDFGNCPSIGRCNVQPLLLNGSITDFDGHLTDGSPAIDSGVIEGAPADDFDGRQRDTHPDIGAFEWE